MRTRLDGDMGGSGHGWMGTWVDQDTAGLGQGWAEIRDMPGALGHSQG